MKRTISIIVTLLAICTVSTTYAYSGGNGTSADPYQVADPADLVQFAGDTANYDKYFILTADIDLTGLPASKQAEGSRKGYFSGKKGGVDANWPASVPLNIMKP